MANPFFVNKNNFYSTALKLLIFIILENNLHQNSLVGPCLWFIFVVCVHTQALLFKSLRTHPS